MYNPLNNLLRWLNKLYKPNTLNISKTINTLNLPDMQEVYYSLRTKCPLTIRIDSRIGGKKVANLNPVES
jgi:hypothetical protein